MNKNSHQGIEPHTPRHPGQDPTRSVYATSDTDLLLTGHKLVLVGYNHKTASLEVRSRFAVPRAELSVLSRRFVELPGIAGCVLLATCNRLEAVLSIRSAAEAEAAFVELVGGQDLEGRAILAQSLFMRTESRAVRHLFRVASSLDAMVLGDAQILAQCKNAYRDACSFGTASPMLHKVFHAAFRCAKQVRTRTELDGAHSVAGAGMALLAQTIGNLRHKKFLIVGVNEMTLTAGERLVKSRASQILICNRTAKHGLELVTKLGGSNQNNQSNDAISIDQVPWENLYDSLDQVDAVITSTGASEPIFRRDQLVAATANRSQPLVLLDLAVPPDVESIQADHREINKTSTPKLFQIIDLEDIGVFQKEVEKRRCQAAAAGEKIINNKVTKFFTWLRNQTLGPKMERLRKETEAVLAKELARQPQELSADESERLTQFGRTLVKRFLGAYRRVDDQD